MYTHSTAADHGDISGIHTIGQHIKRKQPEQEAAKTSGKLTCRACIKDTNSMSHNVYFATRI
jgi:hypothetical protein